MNDLANKMIDDNETLIFVLTHVATMRSAASPHGFDPYAHYLYQAIMQMEKLKNADE